MCKWFPLELQLEGQVLGAVMMGEMFYSKFTSFLYACKINVSFNFVWYIVFCNFPNKTN